MTGSNDIRRILGLEEDDSEIMEPDNTSSGLIIGKPPAAAV